MCTLRRLPRMIHSLRAQLLLWIALPVVVSLLALSLVEIRGHEQAMERMVQQQVNLLATSVGTLIDAHLDRNQNVLHRLAADWPEHATPVGDGTAAFRAQWAPTFGRGLALYADGDLLEQHQAAAWPMLPAVQSLIRQVATEQMPGVIAVDGPDAAGWLFVQAVPVVDLNAPRPGGSRAAAPPLGAAVLAGAGPVQDLAAADLLIALRQEFETEVRLTDAENHTLLFWGRAGDDTSPTSKVVRAQTIVAPAGWQVIVREEWQNLVPPLLHFSNVILVIVVLAVIISLLSAYFGLRHIVQPLRRLDAAVGEVGWGNFAAIQKPVGGVAEIEELRAALAHMAAQIRLYQQELQSYIGAMTRGQEEERRRLARELHDGTVQDLIALNQRIELTELELARNPEKATERLRELRPLLADTMTGLHRQIHNLRPPYLEDLGFVPALEMLVKQVAHCHHLMGDFEVWGQAEHRLDPTVEISAFRIVQEALQNVATHAQAEWVHVELEFQQEGITLRIEDNGRGFAPPTHPYQLAHQGHFGLLGMRERAQLHGGTLRIESREGQGAVITARLPDLQAASFYRANRGNNEWTAAPLTTGIWPRRTSKPVNR